MALLKPLHLHINGQNVASQSSKTFAVHNPITGQPIFDCAAASIPDYEIAIQHAHTAFQTWSTKTTPSQRRLILLRAADILTTYLDDEIVNAPAILSSEVSAVPSYVKLNILAAAAILRDTAGLATVIKGEMIPADRPGTTILVKREPMGVIFAISPWNAPVNLTARAIASPLICGNTVILKPSENSPKSQHLIVRALHEAGLPAGCLNFLPTSPADAPAVTEYAIKHKLVRKVNFTGSDRVGKIIAEWATSCMKTTLLELGGKAPAIVLRDADLEDAAHAIVFGGLMNSGQICMSTERIIVHKDVADEFVAKLLEQLQKVKVGNHLEDPTVTLSGLFSPAAPKRIMTQIDDAISQGAELLYGDRKISGPNKTIMQPHVLDKVKPSMPIFRDESFGPVMCLTRAESEEEAIGLANDSEYTLCASIFTKDVLHGMELASQIRAGSCHINGPTVYIEPPLPNGGVGGRSGNGRFGGMSGIEEFTNKKMVTLVKPGMKYSF